MTLRHGQYMGNGRKQLVLGIGIVPLTDMLYLQVHITTDIVTGTFQMYRKPHT